MRGVNEADLQEINHLPDEDVPAALERLLQSPISEIVRANYFPSLTVEEFRAKIRRLPSSAEFQKQVVAPAIDAMLARTSDGFSVSGFERNPKWARYVYISNHRDILCDPALFTYAMVRNGWDAPLICLGDNLLVAPWITDLIKVNRGVTVKRNLSQRELLRWSHALSELLSRAVTRKQASVWIAQREGRAKDGNDQTHPGVIKMLSLASAAPGSDDSLIGRIEGLHFVPLAVSYEYDPNDSFKALELHLSSQPEGYQKKPGEDVRSMAMGIQGEKGRIHIEIGTEIIEAIHRARALESRKEQVNLIAGEIDRQIHLHYKLWPSNYIAYDLLREQQRSGLYTDAEKRDFRERMESQLKLIPDLGHGMEAVRQWFLQMYARPVENRIRWQTAEAVSPSMDLI
jgi:hypothetical protein